MFTKYFVTLAFATLAVADSLSLYLGPNCNGADEGGYNPIPLGECIAFGQSQSYIIEEDAGVTYNLYSGEGCSQYVGQTSFSGCMPVGEATHVVNEGKQKRAPTIRGRRPMAARSPPSDISRRGVKVQKRVVGDSYQCPNTNGAYFFVVQQSSATTEEIDASAEVQIEGTFASAFNQVYNANNGGTEVNSETAGPQGEDIRVQLTVTEGVIHNIHPNDADPLITALNDFRDQQRFPVEFTVGLYTGVIGHPDAGLIGNFRWFYD
jgi:hypothetical protein